ncbi:MAG: ferrous iron transport protein B [Clostridia bacterium]|nr:ferrous iron transport protein B [Clostridia bacterium]
MVFALVGNQNCGKTTLFNQLTGSNQHVGNFPGVTVESKVGVIRSRKADTVVDLPGIYSLRAYTNEETVTRDFILKNKPDGIINIVDATNIERNLYLSLQLLSMGVPTVIALNMMDEVRGNGGSINIEKLSRALGVCVVPISAAKNEGIDELIERAAEVASKRIMPAVKDFCTVGPVHRCIHSVTHLVEDHAEMIRMSPRFAATKLIEGDEELADTLGLNENERETIEHAVIEMENEGGLDRMAAIANMRYDFIEKACAGTVIHAAETKEHRRSSAIDKVLTGKFTAIPVFIGVMFLVFWLTFGLVGQPLADLLAAGIESLIAVIDTALEDFGMNPVAKSLIVDGVLAGVGSVLSFLPLIVVLFFFLSVLEDTGYMARVAFVTDRLLRKIGLSGRSVVPMLIGFGCSVPAIMATRTLSSERDRKLSVMLVPFVSCSAKLPIYAVFTAAFFPDNAPLVMLGLYLFGIIVGILAARFSGAFIFRGTAMPFVMELPNYRFPSPKSVFMLMKDKAWDFIRKAFTVILAASVIIWFLQTFDIRFNVVENGEGSLLAAVGKFISPLFVPLGFTDWRIPTALITGFTAKEAVVSTLAVLVGTTVSELPNVLMHSPELFTTASAMAFLVFTLLYTPCVAAVATLRREFSSRLGAAGVVLFQCVTAWVCAFIVYRIALLF